MVFLQFWRCCVRQQYISALDFFSGIDRWCSPANYLATFFWLNYFWQSLFDKVLGWALFMKQNLRFGLVCADWEGQSACGTYFVELPSVCACWQHWLAQQSRRTCKHNRSLEKKNNWPSLRKLKWIWTSFNPVVRAYEFLLHLFPDLLAFWFLEKCKTVLMFQLNQNSPTSEYIS